MGIGLYDVKKCIFPSGHKKMTYLCIRTDGKNQGFECSLILLKISQLQEIDTN